MRLRWREQWTMAEIDFSSNIPYTHLTIIIGALFVQTMRQEGRNQRSLDISDRETLYASVSMRW